MANHWRNITEGSSFRFFSPEQVDQILRDGLKRGRQGSHAAIERILRLEPGLQRPDLWKRIRQLKNPAVAAGQGRLAWGPEDDKILREGYQNGWRGKRKAVQELRNRHPGCRPHAIWKRAAKLGLVQRVSKRGQERGHVAWSEDDDRILMDYAGYKAVHFVAKLLHRSEAAVRSRLLFLGKSSRVHPEGYSRDALTKDLHLSRGTIQRLIVQGLLEVRDPRITRESLRRLSKSGPLPDVPSDAPAQSGGSSSQGLNDEGNLPDANSSAQQESPCISAKPRQLSRAKRVWAEVGNTLGVTVTTVEQLILRGVLKLYDPRVTEKSIRTLCRSHGSVINSDFLNRDTRDWLVSTMDFVPHSDESAALRLAPLRKHAQVVRRCKCGREIRGNAFFRHAKRCDCTRGGGQ